ncbi:UDP-glucose 4-epimerase [Actinomycetospora sp. NBRC 106375]|uniref:NAD-dependent epimerase/dehydratase family protein n=1 Tax=Actinomycetospora sp. NBRC 106375 TaxID=3032207 RepID=UPI0024A24DC4|nr:NAD-dependent epimerase/dehydratase family protein [Actinomycetospora sp. NBRC 106375]GLZ46744.1 UDP-glucose 4-epimerase [Actinomycetospora sp. NBRC 106375]
MTTQEIAVVGATGFVGGGLARGLQAAGHAVSGLARSDDAALVLRRRGITPVPGDVVAGLDEAATSLSRFDTVVLAASLDTDDEHRAATALIGTGARVVFLSGSGVMLERTAGGAGAGPWAEDDAFPVEPLAARRVETEALVRGAGGLVLRPPLIWGPGDHGHVAMTYASVAATGAAAFVGEGASAYTNVHVDDVARLLALAVDRAPAGALYHAAGGELTNRAIAAAVAADLGAPARSVTPEEAADVWGEFGALVMGSSSRITAPRARDELGWRPEHPDMLAEVGEDRLRALATAVAR